MQISQGLQTAPRRVPEARGTCISARADGEIAPDTRRHKRRVCGKGFGVTT